MCNFAVVGAVAGRPELRQVLESASADFDTDVSPAAAVLGLFPAKDEVVCVTLDGCSCALLEGLGVSSRRGIDAHVAGPGYAFRRALAEAVLRFGEVHLLVYGKRPAPSSPAYAAPRPTTLANLLRFGLRPSDSLVRIVAQ